MCVRLNKNPQCITKSHFEKSHYEKSKQQQIIKCLICFRNSKIVQPFPHFLHQDIWKPILCSHEIVIHGKFVQGLGTLSPPPAFVLHFAANIFIQYA